MIIGHQKQWQYLRKLAQLGKFSHAYLFYGLEKLGKKTVAFQWASFLLGKRTKDLKTHPDFILIKAEPPDPDKDPGKKEEIYVSQIRDLIWKLSLKPLAAPLKIAIIDNAHLMNQEAQTCLLKTLEEPRGQAILILISDKKQYLFPTILSRLQTIKFNPVSRLEIEKYLSDGRLSAEEIERILGFALDRPGIALDLISEKEKLEKFSQKIRDLNKISDSLLYFRFQYAKNLIEDLETVKDTLDIWLNYLRNILLSRFLPDFSCSNAGFGKYPSKKIKSIINQIEETKFLLASTRANPKLSLEILMMEI